MKWLLVLPLGLAVGCGFRLPSPPGVGGGSDASSLDMPAKDAGNDGNDSNDGNDGHVGHVVVPCATPDATGLVACFEMEDVLTDGTLDDSAPAHRNATSTGMVAAERPVPLTSLAAQVTDMAVTRMAQEAVLDRAAGYTLAMWVHPDSLPAPGKIYGLLDHELQYAMLLGRNGGSEESRCVHTGVTRFEFTDALPTGTWSFLACTWDGSELCAYRWTTTSDNQRSCHSPSELPAATGQQGLAIGHLSNNGEAHSRFDGALDSVQIYDHGLTEDQLCALIDQPAGCMP